MPSRRGEDTAERRNALYIWQGLGRGAARQFWNQKGMIYIRSNGLNRKAARVAFIEGWNSEMRVIAATRRTDDVASMFER